MIEQVKDLRPELGAEPLLPPELLEHGEIHVLEARVAEDVPAHISEGSRRGRSHNRFAGRVAAGTHEIAGAANAKGAPGICRTHRRPGGAIGNRRAGKSIYAACCCTSNTANIISINWSRPANAEACTKGNGICAGTEVGRVAVEIPAIG